MTNDLNDHLPHSLRSLLAEVLKTIETIGTIFFPCPAHLAIALALHFVALPEQEEGEHMGYVYGLLLFALFEDVLSAFL